MAETSADLMLDIDRKLAELPPIPSERCIFRVHDLLRNENKQAYEPHVVAIGPYHRGKDNLRPMEEHKLRYLRQLLQRENEISAEKYIKVMRKSEERARMFYAEPIILESNEFVEMMLLDSCFIVELLRKCEMRFLRDPKDFTFQIGHTEIALFRDLVLLENQLPFFIVMQLFNMTKNSSESLDDLIRMLVTFFQWITPGGLLVAPENPREDDIQHLLGLLHYCCCYEFHSMVCQRNTVPIRDKSLKSAKELQEAGIKFIKIEERNLFDIRFVNGRLEIPTLLVGDSTETFLRNTIAYEQYLPDTSRNYFTAYGNFMDNLVSTSKDVEILTRYGIIHNVLGENDVVAAMLNKLGNHTIRSHVGYEQVYDTVDEHCRKKWNVRWSILRRDLDNKPWAFLSFNYVVAFLLLTVLRTIFSIPSVQKCN